MIDVVLPPLRTPAEGVAYLVQVDREISDLEAKLKDAEARQKRAQEEVLPDIFDRFDTVEETIGNGARAKKSLFVVGSLPKAGEKDSPEDAAAKEIRRQRAIEWASTPEVGWGPLIKTTVSIQFDKGEHEFVERLLTTIRGWNDVQPVVKVDEGIHAMTLQAQVRKRLKEGKAVPLDDLGITALTGVKLTKKPKEH